MTRYNKDKSDSTPFMPESDKPVNSHTIQKDNGSKKILTAKDVASLIDGRGKSWVYQHAEELGGVKVGGTWLFPSEEHIYDCLFGKRKRMEVRLRTKQEKIHGNMVRDKKRSQESRSKKKTGIEESSGRGDTNRHGLF